MAKANMTTIWPLFFRRIFFSDVGRSSTMGATF
jgi:hypothetical protein